ncbi:MAG: hypothetical protein KGI38_10045 [Thaumarchaeota archaeon]|nr:hypothetical protein [Nitrososphaerota archaeon]
MGETSEITTFEELRKLRLADEGYIVIEDTAREPIVHKINAKCISADNFNVKVTLNARRTGKYFWVDSVATAGREFAARRCKVCRPETLLVDPSTFNT